MGCTVRGSNHGRGKGLSSKHQTRSGVHAPSHSKGIRGNYPKAGAGDWLQHDVDHSMFLAVRLRINAATPHLPPKWP